MLTLTSDWQVPPQPLELEHDQVHVWRADLDLPAPAVEVARQTLAPEELERAGRFRCEVDRNRYVLAHGLLRTIVGAYVGVEPRELHFCPGPHGKPYLTGPWNSDRIGFNLAHSAGLALYAVARGREVGIDLERVRADLDTGVLAEQFLSLREASSLRNLPESEQLEAFFRCWTRKEAYLKASGAGLAMSLDQFDVSLEPGEPAALLSVQADPLEACRWSLEHLEPGHGFVGALAVEGQGWHLRCGQWAADWPGGDGQGATND